MRSPTVTRSTREDLKYSTSNLCYHQYFSMSSEQLAVQVRNVLTDLNYLGYQRDMEKNLLILTFQRN